VARGGAPSRPLAVRHTRFTFPESGTYSSKLRDGPVPLLDVRMFARSPAEVSNGAEALHATAAGVACELQFLPVLLEALEKARAA
jgi:hypothetical protein